MMVFGPWVSGKELEGRMSLRLTPRMWVVEFRSFASCAWSPMWGPDVSQGHICQGPVLEGLGFRAV